MIMVPPVQPGDSIYRDDGVAY